MAATKTVLIIEDDPIIGKIYSNKFRAEGFQTEVAIDGEKALEQLKTTVPDLILLDLQLPKLNGVEVLKFIRAQGTTAKTPVIVFSNSYLSYLVQSAWQAGANKVLTKADCTPRQLIEIIRSMLAPNADPSPVVFGTYSAPTKVVQEPVVPTQTAAPAVPVHAVAAVHEPVPPAPMHAGTEADMHFQAQIRQSFLASLPEILVKLRGKLSVLGRAQGDAKLPHLFELYRSIHSLTGNAGVAGFSRMAQLSNAFEALLKELFEKPTSISTSALRTVAHAVDLLSLMHEASVHPTQEHFLPSSILVIDDQMSSNWLVASSLELADLRCITIDDPNAGLKLLEQNRFDLIFLDIDMPEINGFELCGKLRNMPTNEHTPVIFVTGLTDIESRGKSAMSGGNDLITKPFLPVELAVKALTHILKGQCKKPDAR